MAVARALTALITTLVLVLPEALTKAAWVPLVVVTTALVKEGGTHQVGVGVDIGGVVPVKLHQLVGGVWMLSCCHAAWCFFAGGTEFSAGSSVPRRKQLFGIQPAGKAEMML